MSSDWSRVKAVIPAAGKATRLGGACKPLFPLGDGVVLDRSIGFAAAVTTAITVAIPSGRTTDFAHATRPIDGIRWLACEPGLGQGRTIQILLEYVKPLADPVLVIFGDDVTPADEATRVINPVCAHGVWATQAVVWECDPAALADASAVTVLGRWIVAVEEKPVDPAPGWRGCAIYGLSAAAANDILSYGCGVEDVMAAPFNRWVGAGRLVEAVDVRWNVNVNRAADVERAGRLVAGEPAAESTAP